MRVGVTDRSLVIHWIPDKRVFFSSEKNGRLTIFLRRHRDVCVNVIEMMGTSCNQSSVTEFSITLNT